MSYIEGNTSNIYVDDTFVIKQQVRYLEYKLIRNEYDKLQYLRLNTHTPQALFLEDEVTMRIENVGVPLTRDRLPKDWESQMTEIECSLAKAGVIHRDVRPENFTVKDNWIYSN